MNEAEEEWMNLTYTSTPSEKDCEPTMDGMLHFDFSMQKININILIATYFFFWYIKLLN